MCYYTKIRTEFELLLLLLFKRSSGPTAAKTERRTYHLYFYGALVLWCGALYFVIVVFYALSVNVFMEDKM